MRYDRRRNSPCALAIDSHSSGITPYCCRRITEFVFAPWPPSKSYDRWIKSDVVIATSDDIIYSATLVFRYSPANNAFLSRKYSLGGVKFGKKNIRVVCACFHLVECWNLVPSLFLSLSVGESLVSLFLTKSRRIISPGTRVQSWI